MLGRGDLLSNRGLIVKSNAQLLARFHPPQSNHDYGLDALYILPGATPWLEITPTAGGLVLEWDAPLAILQEADHVSGPWWDVSPIEPPGSYLVPSPSGTKFFCLREP